MNKYRIGWGIPSARHGAEPMRARLLGEGRCDRVWLLGDRLKSDRRADRAWMLRDLRKGDTLAVIDGRHLMADEGDTPQRRLMAGLKEIEERGAWAEIIGTDANTRTRSARDALIALALETVSRARQGRTSGRPRLPFTADELAWILPLWTSLAARTNDDARDMVQAEAKRRKSRWHKVTTRQLNSRLGASGRGDVTRRSKTK